MLRNCRAETSMRDHIQIMARKPMRTLRLTWECGSYGLKRTESNCSTAVGQLSQPAPNTARLLP